jgi:hypothetical protein
VDTCGGGAFEAASPATPLPFITGVMPVRDEAQHVAALLRSVLDQSYSASRWWPLTVFPVLHVTYGASFLAGLWKWRRHALEGSALP